MDWWAAIKSDKKCLNVLVLGFSVMLQINLARDLLSGTRVWSRWPESQGCVIARVIRDGVERRWLSLLEAWLESIWGVGEGKGAVRDQVGGRRDNLVARNYFAPPNRIHIQSITPQIAVVTSTSTCLILFFHEFYSCSSSCSCCRQKCSW